MNFKHPFLSYIFVIALPKSIVKFFLNNSVFENNKISWLAKSH